MRFRLFRFAALMLALTLCACAGEAVPAASSSTASSGKKAASSAASSSKATSSKATSSAVSAEAVDVDALVKASGKPLSADVSSCFPAGATEYIVNGGPYLIDAATLARLTTENVTGSGSVKWIGWVNKNRPSANVTDPQKDPFTGVVPVSKLHDPIFMSTALASEGETGMQRPNAGNMYPAQSGFYEIHPIGAVYPNRDLGVSDSLQYTVHITDWKMLFYTDATGWINANPYDVDGNNPQYSRWPALYYLNQNKDDPTLYQWTPVDSAKASFRLGNEAITNYPGCPGYDFYDKKFKIDRTFPNPQADIKLTGADLNANAPYLDTRNAMACLHFWGEARLKFKNASSPSKTYWDGTPMNISNGSEVKGVIVAYTIWADVDNGKKEDAGRLLATIGADWCGKFGGSNGVIQCFSGRNYQLSTEPRVILGHNIGQKNYDKYLSGDNLTKALTLLGLN